MMRYPLGAGVCLFCAFCCAGLFADPVVVSGTADNDYESWIARLNDDRLMVVFDRNPDFRTGDLYVTFSTNDGAPVCIPGLPHSARLELHPVLDNPPFSATTLVW